jgi:Mg-chelatase subunit ChlI
MKFERLTNEGRLERISVTTKQRSIGEILQEFSQHRQVLQQELQKVIVGQDEVIEQLLAAIFTRGHCLLEGVPGLAKTLMVSTLARILDVEFKRVQFTPDLMPSDITGTNVLEEEATGRRTFRFVEGPVFTNILLADEINRTPPKTQAALLQAMQEREVSVGRTTYPLPDPFFTIATQNPIEQEGTYPLPEAQLDRFMFNIKVDYPSSDEEERILAVDDAQRAGRDAQGDVGQGDHQRTEAGQFGGGQRVHHQVRGATGAGHAASRRHGAEVHSRVGRLGRRAAGRPVPDQRRQGAGGDGRPVFGLGRRRPQIGHPRAAAPHQHELSRRRPKARTPTM